MVARAPNRRARPARKKKAAKKPTSKKSAPGRLKKTERLNLLIREDLKNWVHSYASKMDKSVSAIVTEHFIQLRERERREKVHGVDVEQI